MVPGSTVLVDRMKLEVAVAAPAEVSMVKRITVDKAKSRPNKAAERVDTESTMEVTQKVEKLCKFIHKEFNLLFESVCSFLPTLFLIMLN